MTRITAKQHKRIHNRRMTSEVADSLLRNPDSAIQEDLVETVASEIPLQQQHLLDPSYSHKKTTKA
jgi:hypothetical protein